MTSIDQVTDLFEEDEALRTMLIWGNWKPYHEGRLYGLDILSSPSIKGVAVVYNSLDVIAKRTKITAEFDNSESPTGLFAHFFLSCAPYDDRTVAAIDL